jgi:ABC-type amino acid transport substrate-binding protein
MAKLTDKQILELARQYAAIKDQLLDAMKARKGDAASISVEADDIKVVVRSNVIKTWDVKGLAAKLSRRVRSAVIVSKVDARALARAVKAGDVDQALVDEALLSATPSAPFLEVTVRPTS